MLSYSDVFSMDGENAIIFVPGSNVKEFTGQ